MASLFPGIDPFVEAQGFWPDFHARLLTLLCDAIFDRLPEHYEARIEERFTILDIETQTGKRLGPDIGVLKRRRAAKHTRKVPGGGTATLEPVRIPLLIQEEVRETYIKILWRPQRTIVGIIEILSPANKEKPGQDQYLAKRLEILKQPIHLVEIDLLLGGKRMPLQEPYPAGDYFTLVSRSAERPECEVYGWLLFRALPAIPIPLKGRDPDVIVSLAPLVEQAYEKGRYAEWIDYQQPLNLPLKAGTKQRLQEKVSKRTV